MLGVLFVHSIFINVNLNSIIFFVINDSYIVNDNIIFIINIIVDPIDEILFHIIRLSLNDGYRRGIPFIPIKCWGKKVILM